MISKGTIGGIAVVGVGMLCALGMARTMFKLKTERDEYKRSVYALLDTVERQRIDSTRMAYTISQVKLDRDEYKRRNEEDTKTIKELGARLKDIQSISKTEVEARVPISFHLDSQLLDERPITLLDVDRYKSASLIISKDSIIGSVTIKANLTQYMYADYKHRFLWWRWGLRGIKQTIVCDNPNVIIGYASYYSFK